MTKIVFKKVVSMKTRGRSPQRNQARSLGQCLAPSNDARDHLADRARSKDHMECTTIFRCLKIKMKILVYKLKI